MTLYAAYGPNLDPAFMRDRCPSSPLRATGWLKDWRLTFGAEAYSPDGALATIVPEAGATVFVALYELADRDERELDSWEGLGLYRKLRLRVATLDGDVLAWLYVLEEFEGGLPSARYLRRIADAAEQAGAPDEYVLQLRQRPCQRSTT